jgi:cysteinyl-tRNA synthetase
LFNLAREINKTQDPDEALQLACQLRAGAELLGVLANSPAEWFGAEGGSDTDSAAIDALLEQRTAARAAKDFAEADRIRDQLSDMGVIIEDSPDGPRWRRPGS